MNDTKQANQQTRDAEAKLLRELRIVRRRQRREPSDPAKSLTRGQRIADMVAATMGSWRFIIIQTTILFIWIGLNVLGLIQHWDPYPFILLNLALSFQAAYAAPFIMMSQNRQQDIDRLHAANDYKINVKAELEIELLHEKIELLHTKLDALREKEVLALTNAVQQLGGGGAQAGLRLELFVNDIARSRDFYQSALGFTASGAASGGYVAMTRGGITLSLNDRAQLPADHPVQAMSGERLGRGVEIVLEVDDVEADFARAQSLQPGCELTSQPWGLRDFRVIDPDGYYVRVTGRRT
ncbi:DUF1003 domain-containing protein [Devosia sp.]|uniref:DUF1003 domain-containing protein n=1 Tax=Devosia sp. TaxID=1871048 RepID=UPI003267184A